MKKNIQQTGFTLIETVIAIAIFSVLMLAVSALFISLYRQQSASIGMIQRTAAANRLTKMIGGELREANYGVGEGSLWVAAEKNSITFYSDLDNDGKTEKISYTLAAGETDLKKKVVEPGASAPYYNTAGVTTVVCSDVRNRIEEPVFTYYDDSYVGESGSLTIPVNFTDVRLVGVSLILNSLNVNSSYPLHVETKIDLRNQL